MSKHHQAKSGTQKPKRKKAHRASQSSSAATAGIMTGMVSNFRQIVTLEKKSGSKVGKYVWGAIFMLLILAFIFWGIR